eukprot:jgi/Bigna1/127147/aug1.4_g1855
MNLHAQREAVALRKRRRRRGFWIIVSFHLCFALSVFGIDKITKAEPSLLKKKSSAADSASSLGRASREFELALRHCVNKYDKFSELEKEFQSVVMDLITGISSSEIRAKKRLRFQQKRELEEEKEGLLQPTRQNAQAMKIHDFARAMAKLEALKARVQLTNDTDIEDDDYDFDGELGDDNELELLYDDGDDTTAITGRGGRGMTMRTEQAKRQKEGNDDRMMKQSTFHELSVNTELFGVNHDLLQRDLNLARKDGGDDFEIDDEEEDEQQREQSMVQKRIKKKKKEIDAEAGEIKTKSRLRRAALGDTVRTKRYLHPVKEFGIPTGSLGLVVGFAGAAGAAATATARSSPPPFYHKNKIKVLFASCDTPLSLKMGIDVEKVDDKLLVATPFGFGLVVRGGGEYVEVETLLGMRIPEIHKSLITPAPGGWRNTSNLKVVFSKPRRESTIVATEDERLNAVAHGIDNVAQRIGDVLCWVSDLGSEPYDALNALQLPKTLLQSPPRRGGGKKGGQEDDETLISYQNAAANIPVNFESLPCYSAEEAQDKARTLNLTARWIIAGARDKKSNLEGRVLKVSDINGVYRAVPNVLVNSRPIYEKDPPGKETMIWHCADVEGGQRAWVIGPRKYLGLTVGYAYKIGAGLQDKTTWYTTDVDINGEGEEGGGGEEEVDEEREYGYGNEASLVSSSKNKRNRTNRQHRHSGKYFTYVPGELPASSQDYNVMLILNVTKLPGPSSLLNLQDDGRGAEDEEIALSTMQPSLIAPSINSSYEVDEPVEVMMLGCCNSPPFWAPARIEAVEADEDITQYRSSRVPYKSPIFPNRYGKAEEWGSGYYHDHNAKYYYGLRIERTRLTRFARCSGIRVSRIPWFLLRKRPDSANDGAASKSCGGDEDEEHLERGTTHMAALMREIADCSDSSRSNQDDDVDGYLHRRSAKENGYSKSESCSDRFCGSENDDEEGRSSSSKNAINIRDGPLRFGYEVSGAPEKFRYANGLYIRVEGRTVNGQSFFAKLPHTEGIRLWMAKNFLVMGGSGTVVSSPINIDNRAIETWFIGSSKDAGTARGDLCLPGTVGVEDYWYLNLPSGAIPMTSITAKEVLLTPDIIEQKLLSSKEDFNRAAATTTAAEPSTKSTFPGDAEPPAPPPYPPPASSSASLERELVMQNIRVVLQEQRRHVVGTERSCVPSNPFGPGMGEEEAMKTASSTHGVAAGDERPKGWGGGEEEQQQIGLRAAASTLFYGGKKNQTSDPAATSTPPPPLYQLHACVFGAEYKDVWVDLYSCTPSDVNGKAGESTTDPGCFDDDGNNAADFKKSVLSNKQKGRGRKARTRNTPKVVAAAAAASTPYDDGRDCFDVIVADTFRNRELDLVGRMLRRAPRTWIRKLPEAEAGRIRSRIDVGDTVEIFGLKDRKYRRLNGQIGHVVTLVMDGEDGTSARTETDRGDRRVSRVRVALLSSLERKSFKLRNVRHAAPSSMRLLDDYNASGDGAMNDTYYDSNSILYNPGAAVDNTTAGAAYYFTVPRLHLLGRREQRRMDDVASKEMSGGVVISNDNLFARPLRLLKRNFLRPSLSPSPAPTLPIGVSLSEILNLHQELLGNVSTEDGSND